MILVWIFLILEALTSALCNGILSLETQEGYKWGLLCKSILRRGPASGANLSRVLLGRF